MTQYDVVLGQLLLTDFTVVKFMLTAFVVGMIGIYAMKNLGWVSLSIKPGSWGMNGIGGLIFGLGLQSCDTVRERLLAQLEMVIWMHWLEDWQVFRLDLVCLQRFIPSFVPASWQRVILAPLLYRNYSKSMIGLWSSLWLC